MELSLVGLGKVCLRGLPPLQDGSRYYFPLPASKNVRRADRRVGEPTIKQALSAFSHAPFSIHALLASACGARQGVPARHENKAGI